MIKHSVKFELFREDDSTCCPIRARVTFGGKRLDFYLGYSVAPDKWDAEGACVTSGKNRNGKTAAEINRAILTFSDTVEEIFTRFDHVEKRTSSLEEFRQLVNEAVGKAKQATKVEKSFFGVFDESIRTMGEQNE
jgi:hypothetical protein